MLTNLDISQMLTNYDYYIIHHLTNVKSLYLYPMARGRKKQPLALIEKKGTGNSTRLKQTRGDNKQYPFIYRELPSPPEDLKEIGISLWNRQLSMAMNIYGYISFMDLAVFGEYCWVYQELQRTKRMAEVDEDFQGGQRSPLHIQMDKLRKSFLELSREFGFTPSARSNIKLGPEPDDNMDEFADGL